MGMALFGNGAGAAPISTVFLAYGHHIPNTVSKVIPLFDDGTPGGPNGGCFGN